MFVPIDFEFRVSESSSNFQAFCQNHPSDATLRKILNLPWIYSLNLILLFMAWSEVGNHLLASFLTCD